MKKYFTKEGIISGIAASVLFTFMLQPMIEFLMAKKGSVVEGIGKYVVSQCAKTTYISLLCGFITVIFSCVLGLSLGILFSNLSLLKKKDNKVEASSEKKENIEENVKEVEEISKEISRLERYSIILKSIMSVVLILWLCLIFITYVLPSSLYSKFIVSVEKVSPYVSESDVVSLKSKWREMETWSDYEEIEEIINNYETKKK